MILKQDFYDAETLHLVKTREFSDLVSFLRYITFSVEPICKSKELHTYVFSVNDDVLGITTLDDLFPLLNLTVIQKYKELQEALLQVFPNKPYLHFLLNLKENGLEYIKNLEEEDNSFAQDLSQIIFEQEVYNFNGDSSLCALGSDDISVAVSPLYPQSILFKDNCSNGASMNIRDINSIKSYSFLLANPRYCYHDHTDEVLFFSTDLTYFTFLPNVDSAFIKTILGLYNDI